MIKVPFMELLKLIIILIAGYTYTCTPYIANYHWILCLIKTIGYSDIGDNVMLLTLWFKLCW